GLTAREVAYLVDHEWAETADDVLWRRSKLGLRLAPDQRAAVDLYLAVPRSTPLRAAAEGRA
ncbi:MAG: glycerol-3-phosphate dehydrogenase, partial [Burkholderiaceae bacterium]